MIYDLFPTRVAVNSLEENHALELTLRYAETSARSWDELLTDKDINVFTDVVSESFPGKYLICDGWIRNGYSSFDLHCDNHYGNQLVSVVQLYGDQDSGGDLILYDPSWKNPQWMSDTKQSDVNSHTIKFIPGQMVTFPSNVWHRVSEYQGKISRITLNLMFRRIE